ncbi:MAG TPA: aldose epimerase family protein [Chthonomonadaceae bacterium]|nr:aldose epimerase family protein [Chthonomonadaceae bacterium]
MTIGLGALAAILALGAAPASPAGEKAMAAAPARASVVKTAFGKTPDGRQVSLFTLTNANGMVAKITDYGAILTELHTPDRNGKMGDVVLGFDNLDSYLKGHPFFGATVGRYANRIAKGKFTLDGKEYTLAVNNGPNHLHGGTVGFDKVVWAAKPVRRTDGPAVEFHYLSKDGEEGYPGNLDVTVVYTLTNKNGLRIDYTATTDQDTVCNLTNHSYFNLGGQGDIRRTELMLNCDKFVPVDDTLIPTGELQSVKGTNMDFTTMHPIGDHLDEVGKDPTGYDHCYVVNGGGKKLTLAAKAYDPTSGREMTVYTTEPGIQLYTSNFLDGTNVGKGGQVYQKHAAFCLEAGRFPDTPNHPKFPSAELRPGETYRQRTEYVFSAR